MGCSQDEKTCLTFLKCDLQSGTGIPNMFSKYFEIDNSPISLVQYHSKNKRSVDSNFSAHFGLNLYELTGPLLVIKKLFLCFLFSRHELLQFCESNGLNDTITER